MYYIYKTTNTVNNKTYVGQRKWNKQVDKDKYMGSGKLLSMAKLRYGAEMFIKEIIISNILKKEDADKLEKEHILLNRAIGKCEYNITAGGEGFCANHTDLTRLKISESLIGNKRCLGKNLNNTHAKGNIVKT
jgi:hypothetical protein